MNAAFFVVIVMVSFIVVRIGAIAFHLTGMRWSQAKFQALSCFTGTGFTTHESELIVGHSQRRRIASFLMVLGNAGLVALIATFANSLRPNLLFERLMQPVMPDWMPALLIPIINLVIIVLGFYVILRLFGRMHVSDKVTNLLRRTLLRSRIIESLSIEEPVMSAYQCDVVLVVIGEKSRLIDRSIGDITAVEVQVLAIESQGKICSNPAPDTPLHLGDSLLCLGQPSVIRKEML